MDKLNSALAKPLWLARTSLNKEKHRGEHLLATVLFCFNFTLPPRKTSLALCENFTLLTLHAYSA